MMGMKCIRMTAEYPEDLEKVTLNYGNVWKATGGLCSGEEKKSWIT